MTDPKPCVYDRNLGYRATIGEHDDDCTDPGAHRGCNPCLIGHCIVCNRTHTTSDHPNTCPDCVGSVREDLTEVTELYRQLPDQAREASNDGRPWAGARIPGAAAMVAMGPSVDPQLVRVNREHHLVHLKGDMIPPLAVLAHWEETWAAWLGHDRSGRTTITRSAGYLDRALSAIAQQTPSFRDGLVVAPPEFGEFSKAIGTLRADLERLVHNEQVGEHGVDCFECGAQLTRRIRDPKRCHHKTPARTALADHLRERPDAQLLLAKLRVAGEQPTRAQVNAARLPSPVMVAAARMPCDRCDQGGIEDPRPGISWECPACRKRYTPGEYATAVRRDLLDREDGDGWTEIGLAADAATTLVGHTITALLVRRWMDRNKIGACCVWSYDHAGECRDAVWHWDCWLIPKPDGKRLVYWPDIADEAVASVERARVAAIARDEKREAELAEEAAKAAAEEAAAAKKAKARERRRARAAVARSEKITA